MPVIGVRELQERTAEVLGQVHEQKAEYVITHQGRPVAVLLPVNAEVVEAAMVPAGQRSVVGRGPKKEGSLMFQKLASTLLIVPFLLLVIIAGCAAPEMLQVTTNKACVSGGTNESACNVIEGFDGNTVSSNVTGATISGGGEPALPNRVTANFGTVGGGLDNNAGDRATVAGGSHNTANGFRATISGGNNNTASGAYSTLAGGENNTSNYFYTTVSGGNDNTASGRHATVGGGSGNTASFSLATVSGGANNTASGLDATVGGGSHNIASGTYATISGGSSNSASDIDTTVSGGSGNIATGETGTIGGGLVNRVTDNYATIGGGRGNTAGNANDDLRDASYSTVGGGLENVAGGSFATVPGGAANVAGGDFSFAAGRRAKIDTTHDGSFLFADSNDEDFHSAAANEFAVRATGGVRLVTAVDSAGNPTAGVRLAQGSGSWASLSDRNAKDDFVPVDGREVLSRLMTVPINTWSYKTQDPAIRHMGPVAQDFAVFGVGEDDQYINMIDADGVALAAIQGLYAMLQEKDGRIQAQQQQITALKAEITAQQSQLAALDARLALLEQKGGQNGHAAQAMSTDALLAWPQLIGVFLVGLTLAVRSRAQGSAR
jgi:prevent-host-death family protein